MSKLNVQPKIDIAFKKIFAENKELLRALLSHALKLNFQNIEILSPEILPQDVDKKFCRFDVRATVDGQEFDIEIQLGDRDDYRARSVYYWAMLFANLKKGRHYNEIAKTICVNFVNFDMFGTSDFHSKFQILESNRHEILTDKAEWHFFELKKIPRVEHSTDPLVYWLNFIKAETDEEIYALENIQDEVLQTAITEVKRLNKDPEFISTVQKRQQALEEEESAVAAAEEKGKLQNQLEIAKKLFNKGMNIEFISETTGLDHSTLKKIKQ